MAAKSYTLDNSIINFFLRADVTGETSPATVEVALYTVAPTASGGGTEVSTAGTGYARQVITFDAPANGVTQNSALVTFPVAMLSWGTVVAAAIHDQGTGNLLYFGNLSASKTIDPGDTASFAAGTLSITEQ